MILNTKQKSESLLRSLREQQGKVETLSEDLQVSQTKLFETRMHLSRMRSVRCSGRFLGVCQIPPSPSPVDRITDACEKQNLSATVAADGNNIMIVHNLSLKGTC